MARVIPFRGIHYSTGRVRGDQVVAPPYDIIGTELRERLYGLSPYNVVRIDYGKKFPEDDERRNKYTRAAGYLTDWLEEGVLKRSERPGFYVYRMEYEWEGEKRSLTGFFALVELVELGEGVYPHEATRSTPKHDRLSLMQATRTNTSPIYALYGPSKEGVTETLRRATEDPPCLEAANSRGDRHRMWVLDEPGQVKALEQEMAGSAIFIADGHHRYETALEYRRLMHEEEGAADERPYDYVLMFLADLKDEGLTVLPTHRLVTADLDAAWDELRRHFDTYQLAPDADIIQAIRGKKHTFGLYCERGRYALTYRGEGLQDVDPALGSLDVVILHRLVLGGLIEVGGWAYEMDYAASLARVDGGEYDAAFFLNPTSVADVERVALSGLRMPPKSTYFYPKVQTGFVMNSLRSF
ncbi:MAG: DUF1015 domain-containing protein [Nitrospirota bacterium]|jgi:uncharacterized protein (DUF1015 family)